MARKRPSLYRRQKKNVLHLPDGIQLVNAAATGDVKRECSTQVLFTANLPALINFFRSSQTILRHVPCREIILSQLKI